MPINTNNPPKPALDLGKISQQSVSMFENSQDVVNNCGISGDNIPELNPSYDWLDYEVVYTGKHDSTICLGRDRAGQFYSEGGYGLEGNTSCAAIDIVVGRKSADVDYDIKNNLFIGPDFVTDAARIYISQKSDIDRNFSIPSTKTNDSIAKSAIALKSDAVRIIARENLKLVVGTDQRNALGQTISTRGGVDLIGGNIDDGLRKVQIVEKAESQELEILEGGMQPIPLGVNLNYCLKEMVSKIDKLISIVELQTAALTQFMNNMSSHVHMEHINAYLTVPSAPSIESQIACEETGKFLIETTQAELKNLQTELSFYKAKHLTPGSNLYINSSNHSLN